MIATIFHSTATMPISRSTSRKTVTTLATALKWLSLLFAVPARASFLSGDALDTAADWIAIVVLIVVPIVVIVVFWLVHVLPERIAEQRHHPQAGAIQTLCLLSLVFGGLLWPLAWLWAFTKPVAYRVAYGNGQRRRVARRDGREGESGKRCSPTSSRTCAPSSTRWRRAALCRLN
jgi:hypothetical protein